MLIRKSNEDASRAQFEELFENRGQNFLEKKRTVRKSCKNQTKMSHQDERNLKKSSTIRENRSTVFSQL
jgi:hypothetical protein